MPRDKKLQLPPKLTPNLEQVKDNPKILFIGQVRGGHHKDKKGRDVFRCRTWSLRQGQLVLSERSIVSTKIPPMMLAAWYRSQNLADALHFSGFVPDQSLEIFSEKEISKSPVTSRLSSKGLMIQVGGGATYTTEDGVQYCRIVNCSWRWGVLVRFLYNSETLIRIQPRFSKGAAIPSTITRKVLVQSSEEFRINIDEFESVFYLCRDDEWEQWMDGSEDYFLVRHHIEWKRNRAGRETLFELKELIAPLPVERALAIIARAVIECNRFCSLSPSPPPPHSLTPSPSALPSLPPALAT